MATIQIVNAIYAIEGKDRIVQYGINGWKVIDQAGKYNVGDRVIFCEIDSFLPEVVVPFMSEKKAPKEYGGVKGHVLKTIKMGGAPSQGLLLPIGDTVGELGDDVSEDFGIVKYDPPETGSAEAKGSFPHFIHKTDQNRIQNVYSQVDSMRDEVLWEKTEKLEGSSMTVYLMNSEYGVCSRNQEIKTDMSNMFVNTAKALDLETRLRLLGRNIALQGELIGPGVQQNIYKLTHHDYRVYDIFDIDKQKYLSVGDRYHTMSLLFGEEFTKHHVPVLDAEYNMGTTTLNELIDDSTAGSVLRPEQLREGVVYKAMDGQYSFKVISIDYLLKQK